MSTSSHSVVCALVVVSVLAGQRIVTAAQGVSNEALTAVESPQRSSVEWHFKGRKLLVYNFSTNQFKPYVRELRTLRGDNVLRDAPADHLHHHGLMYAIWVNGINFWEEAGQPGHERHVKLLAHDTSCGASGLPQASFTELVHWVPHGDHARADTTPAALLVERRTLTLTVDEAKEEVALAWHGEFEVGTRTNQVKLHGSEYNGLGLRLPAAWDHVAYPENSEYAAFPPNGQPGAVAARWGAMSQKVDGRTRQVALFTHPRNDAGTNFFFAMTEPFAYLAATQGLARAPLTYLAGQRFSRDYLLLVYPVARPRAQLERRYQEWTRTLIK